MAEPAVEPVVEPAPAPVAPPVAEPPVEPAPAVAAEPAPEPAPEPEAFAWPDEWREKLAEAGSAGDEKEYKAQMNLLKMQSDPSKVWGIYRELQKAMSSGGMVKLPKADATPEERAAYYKQIGAPEEPEKLLDGLELSNGLVLGDLDRGPAEEFVKAVHGAVSPQEFTNKAVEWYLGVQEQNQAALDELDETTNRETTEALREAWGNGYKRELAIAKQAFNGQPEGLADMVMAARLPDGRKLGDTAEGLQWLNRMARESFPVETVVQDGPGSIQSVDEEIKSIEKDMRDDRRAYFKDNQKQARYRELLEARDKHQQRNAA